MAINGSRNLGSATLDKDYFDADSESPMSSLGNLMDVMLVFACGLIIALVAHYGVQLAGTTDVQGSKQEVDTSQLTKTEKDVSQSGQYDEVGKVYKDADTGKLYIVEDSGSSAVEEAASGNSSSSSSSND
ncbi:MAG: DUF2149 domain-containing protein [Coriobacteriales bacterium]|jgi:hypothetical protein